MTTLKEKIFIISDIEVNPSTSFEIDPLSGTATECVQPTFYRLDSIVFAEPFYAPNSTSSNSESALEPPSPFTGDFEQLTQSVVNLEDTGRRNKSTAEYVNNANMESKAKSQINKRGPPDDKQYRCEVCDACFPQRYLLKRHWHVHRGATHTCPICHKTLSVRTQLAVHMRSHSPARRFACARCGRGFTRRAGLALHARFLHPTADSLACALCGERFARRAQLHRHRAALHAPARRLACEECGRMCSTLGALAAHSAKTHRGRRDTVKPKPIDLNIGIPPSSDDTC